MEEFASANLVLPHDMDLSVWSGSSYFHASLFTYTSPRLLVSSFPRFLTCGEIGSEAT